MAVTTGYTSLLANVADYLARTDLTAQIPVFVQNMEERFFRDSENWGAWMESALSVTITSNVAAVPADYLGLRIAYISGNNSLPLRRITLEQLYSRYPRSVSTSGGSAQFITRNRTNFEFGPVNASGTLAGTYYAKPAPLRSYSTGGADAVAHYLIVNAPDLLLFGALLEATPFIKKDDRLLVWQSAYQAAQDAYRSRLQEEDSSGSSIFTVAM